MPIRLTGLLANSNILAVDFLSYRLLVTVVTMMSLDENSFTVTVTMMTSSSVGDVITIIKCGKETYKNIMVMRGTSYKYTTMVNGVTF